MKLLLLLGSSLLLAPVALFALLTSPHAYAWLFVPVVVLTMLMAGAIAAQQWFRVIGTVVLQALIVVLALSMIAVAMAILASLATPHWMLWAIFGTALFALVVAIRPVTVTG